MKVVPNESPPKTSSFSMYFMGNSFNVSSLLTFSLRTGRDRILNTFLTTQRVELQL